MNTTETSQTTYLIGLNIRKEVMGKPHVEKVLEGASEFTRPLQALITKYAWGEVWSRTGLDRRTRSMLNLAMLTALNRPHELAGHIKGAIRNRVTEDEIKEVLLQSMIYCGAPAAQEAFRVAEAVLREPNATDQDR